MVAMEQVQFKNFDNFFHNFFIELFHLNITIPKNRKLLSNIIRKLLSNTENYHPTTKKKQKLN